MLHPASRAPKVTISASLRRARQGPGPNGVFRRRRQCRGSRRRVHNIRFKSSFEAINLPLRDQCRGYERNNVVYAQHWRHDDSPHPTLCVIHGFLGSAYLANGPSSYRCRGSTAPVTTFCCTRCHFTAAGPKSIPLQRLRLLRARLRGIAEAMAQAVFDFRSSTIWSSPVSTGLRSRHFAGRLHIGIDRLRR